MKFYNLLEKDTLLIRKKATMENKTKRRSYNDEPTKILLENLDQLSIKDTKYKVAMILTAFTGVLLSGLMGLEWQYVDFKMFF